VIGVVANSIIPVYAIVLLGFVAGRRSWLAIDPFIDFVIYFAQPCLVVASLAAHPLAVADLALIAGGNLFVVLAVGLLALAWSRLSGDRGADLFVCAMFANVANLPLPLALFAFGAGGLSYQVAYFAANALLLYTLGVAIASHGGRGIWQFLRTPLPYAVIAGVVISAGGWTVPAALFRPVEMLGSCAIPLLLFALGHKMGTARAVGLASSAAIVVLRSCGGLAAALLFLSLVEAPLEVRRAILLGATMPAAVQTFMIMAKFGSSSPRAATATVLSTAAAGIYIPFLMAWLSTME
jgi:predicted permease